MSLTREARLKSGFGHLYPEAHAGAWEPATVLAQRIHDRLLARHGFSVLLKGRLLPDDHFEFRGGLSNAKRLGGHLSRLGDRTRSSR